MKGYASPHSPFARKVRVVAIETGQSDAIDWTMIEMANKPAGLAAANPLGQVPAVTAEDGAPLYDSAVICDYLDSRHDGTKLIPASGASRWRALRLQALGDGLGAASAALAAERRRPEDRRFDGALAGHSGKIAAALAALEGEIAALDGALTIGPIAAACAMGYMELRDCAPGWRDAHPALASWYDRFCARPSMQQTAPS